jgi:hypothetical protein
LSVSFIVSRQVHLAAALLGDFLNLLIQAPPSHDVAIFVYHHVIRLARLEQVVQLSFKLDELLRVFIQTRRQPLHLPLVEEALERCD